MAESLLDVIRKQTANAARSSPGPLLAGAPPIDTSARLNRMLAAGSGLATGGATAPSATSNAEELAAAADTAGAMRDVSTASAISGAQLGLQAQQVSEAERQSRVAAETKRSQITDAAARRASQLIQESRDANLQLDAEENRAKAEQIALAMRLSNQKYVAELQAEAVRRRITDAESFKRDLYEAEFGEAAKLFGDAQTFRKVMAMDEDEYQRMLASMDLDAALAVYHANQATMRAQAPYVAAQGAAQAGIGIWAGAEKRNAENNKN